LEFPFDGWTKFEALETENEHVLVDPAALRRTYMENLERHLSILREGCGRHRISLREMSTHIAADVALAEMLTERANRR